MFNDISFLIHTLKAASLGYICIIVLLRISGKRTLSKWNSFDFVITITLGSILASATLLKNVSIVQGSFALLLLIFYQYLISQLISHFPMLRNIVKASPALLFFEGEFKSAAMKRERVTEDEVLAAIRQKGISCLAEVGAVVLETDGSFSVMQDLCDYTALRNVKGIDNRRLAHSTE